MLEGLAEHSAGTQLLPGHAPATLSRSCCHIRHVSCWWLPMERPLQKKKKKKSGSQRMPQAMACCLGWLTACHSCSCLVSFSSDTYQRTSHMRSQDHSLSQRSSCITYLIHLSLPRANCWNTITTVPAKLDLYWLQEKTTSPFSDTNLLAVGFMTSLGS